ncbi:MFS transporter [Microvirga yunnanensis]|uniref:MFS transporter n=1 Tax=Microvirga yunnanensis TaxID=2953740 RepID=UPI0021C77E9A|nr:MFS transporter [Microvirga sp. HBU65207]
MDPARTRQIEPLPWKSLASLLLPMFSIALGYSVILPILPSLVERLAGTSDAATLSQHTGLLMGAYMLAIFFFAPIWGKVSDRYGRRLVILLGLGGFAVVTAGSALVDSLPGVYFGRFFAGLFSSAVAPASYALVGDHAPSREWRAHQYTLLNIAGTAGFLVGPLLGATAFSSAQAMFMGRGEASLLAPSLATSALAITAGLSVWCLLPQAVSASQNADAQVQPQYSRAVIVRLLGISFTTALAVGSFEVGLALRGKEVLGLDTYRIGMMFAECSLIMFLVQAVVFSPLVKPDWTRWLIAPALIALAGGLIAVPLTTSYVPMTVAVAVVAAAAGVLSPIAVYWISVTAGEKQGTELGFQTAAASLGQTVGSALGGLLFSQAVIPNASFTLAAAAVVASLATSHRLARQLIAGPKVVPSL